MCGLGLRPDLVTWNTVASGFALAGDNQMTAKLVGGMREGRVPDGRYHLDIAYFWIRAELQVRQGAHSAPEHDVRRRPLPAKFGHDCQNPACVRQCGRGQARQGYGYAVVASVEQDLTVSSALVDMCAKFGLKRASCLRR
jgi:hypothetical protein